MRRTLLPPIAFRGASSSGPSKDFASHAPLTAHQSPGGGGRGALWTEGLRSVDSHASRTPATPRPGANVTRDAFRPPPHCPKPRPRPLPRCAPAARAAAHPSVPGPQTRPRSSLVGGTAWRRRRQGSPQRRRGRECGGGERGRQGRAAGSGWGAGWGLPASRGARGGAEDAPHSPAAAAGC